MAIPIGIIASSIYKGISCLLEVIGWDNVAGSWLPITLYAWPDGWEGARTTYNLYYNGNPLIVGSIIAYNSTGTPLFNGTSTGLLLDVPNNNDSGWSYSVNSVGVVTYSEAYNV